MEKHIEIAVQKLIDWVEGGISQDIMSLLDDMIDSGDMSKKDYADHEMEILAMIDSQIFTCAECNWTVPIEEMSYEASNNTDQRCNNCND